ncbi:FliO/MopB family protein [Bremerella cremea]|nr:flagellar biosynthetic protein FliO [Bremerella cremea]
MRNAIVIGCLVGWGLVIAHASQGYGNGLSGSQAPPNQPMQIRAPQAEPPRFPPLAQALHVEEVAQQPAANPQLPAVAPPADSGEALPLPRKLSHDTDEASAIPTFNFQSNKTASIAASLFVVIGLFLVFAWVGKKNMKPGSGRLSKEIIQVLGKSQLSGKQQLELVRVGQKLLLLCVTPHSVETLTEITEPTEVERLLAIVRQDSPGSMSSSFQEVLSQMGHKPARGFLEA